MHGDCSLNLRFHFVPSLTAPFSFIRSCVSEYHEGYLDSVADPTLPQPTQEAIATTTATTAAAETTKTALLFEPEIQSCPLESLTNDVMCLREKIHHMIGWVKVRLQGGEKSCEDGGHAVVSRNPNAHLSAGATTSAEGVQVDNALSSGLGIQGGGLDGMGKSHEGNVKGLKDNNDEQAKNTNGLLDSTNLSAAFSSSPLPASSGGGVANINGYHLTINLSPLMSVASDNVISKIGEENVRIGAGDVMDGPAVGGGSSLGASARLSLAIPAAGPLEVVYEAPDERESSAHDRESTHSSLRENRSSCCDSDAMASRRPSLHTPMGSIRIPQQQPPQPHQQQPTIVSPDTSVPAFTTVSPFESPVEILPPLKRPRAIIYTPNGYSLFDFFEYFTIALPVQLFAYFQRWFMSSQPPTPTSRPKSPIQSQPLPNDTYNLHQNDHKHKRNFNNNESPEDGNGKAHHPNTSNPAPSGSRWPAVVVACWSAWSYATDSLLSHLPTFSHTLSTNNPPSIIHARGVYKYCSDLRSFSYLIGCAISFFLTSMTTFMMIASLSDTSLASDDPISSDNFDSYLSTFGYLGLYGYLITVSER